MTSRVIACLPAAWLILAAVACSGPSAAPEQRSGDDASTSSDAGLDSAGNGDTEGALPCPAHPTSGDFPLDVAGVLRDKCQTCHRRPPVQHAPFPLLNYEDTVGPDPIPPYIGKPIWRVMHIVIQTDGVPHMPFGSAPQLTPSEFQVLDGWLSACAVPVAEGTGGDMDAVSTNAADAAGE